jgi:hypothetical protein
MNLLEKSAEPPTTKLMIGITMSLTIESTIFEKAAPMMMPTARSITLPRMANDLNSDRIPLTDAIIFLLDSGQLAA